MRVGGWMAVAALVVAGGSWFLVRRDPAEPRPRVEEAPSRPGAAGEEPTVLPAPSGAAETSDRRPPDAAPEGGSNEEPLDDGRLPPPGSSQVRVPMGAEFWRRCQHEADPELVRACIRRALDGRVLSPEELAAHVCGAVPPDGPDIVLMEVTAAAWPAAGAARHMQVFHAACNAPGSVWSGFLARQATADPVWLDTFTASLSPELVFGEGGTLLVQALAWLVADGRADLLPLLDAGAQGAFGASVEQVVFAMRRSFDQRSGPHERVEWLRTLATSPELQARSLEVQSLVKLALDPSVLGVEPGLAADFLRETLADPRLGPEAARALLELERFQRLPAGLPADVLAAARDLAR